MGEVERFLKSINFNYTQEFKDASIKKVLFNRETKIYNVYLNCQHVLDYDLVNDLFLHAKKGINGKDKCYIELLYENVSNEDILNYLHKILESIIFEHPSLVGIENSVTELMDQKICFEVATDTEQKALLNYQDLIKDKLKKYGLGIFEIEVILNREKNLQLKEEMQKQQENMEIVKEKSPVIFGSHKDGEVTLIKNIIGEQKGIIIEGYIFGMENMERKGQKATAYIINLKVSDKTDSFMVKFVRFNKDEYNQILNGIKVGNWYRITGNIEMDNFLRQMILNGRGIEEIKNKDNNVVDEEEEKRVELHTHTMMSAMDGVIDAKALVKFAQKLGHKAVAVTDHIVYKLILIYIILFVILIMALPMKKINLKLFMGLR